METTPHHCVFAKYLPLVCADDVKRRPKAACARPLLWAGAVALLQTFARVFRFALRTKSDEIKKRRKSFRLHLKKAHFTGIIIWYEFCLEVARCFGPVFLFPICA